MCLFILSQALSEIREFKIAGTNYFPLGEEKLVDTGIEEYIWELRRGWGKREMPLSPSSWVLPTWSGVPR